jgi:hypothetical protein
VIRSAVLAADGRSLYQHRVDRRTRADLGVWQQALGDGRHAAGKAVQVLPGLAADAAHGRTFTTELLIAPDGRLVVSSCGLEACRDRVLDPSSGTVGLVERIGSGLGVVGDRLIARDVCPGDPCAVLAVDLPSGGRTVVTERASAAAVDGGSLVYEADGGRVASLDLATGRTSGPIEAGGVPIRRGSLAQAGAEVPGGSVGLAPGGRPTATGTRVLDVGSMTSTSLGEVRR